MGCRLCHSAVPLLSHQTRGTGLTSVAPPGPGAPFRSLSVVVAERDPSTTTGRSPTSPTPIDPLLESADAESTIRTFYTLFESYLPYMPLADTLESLSRGTLSELVLTCMHMLVKRSVHSKVGESSSRPHVPDLVVPSMQDASRNALPGGRSPRRSRQSSHRRALGPPLPRHCLQPSPSRIS